MSLLRTQIDRLVDGELSPVEQRRLLTEIAADPQGWKLCATAFLEAQSWRGEITALTSSAEKPATAKPANRVAKFDGKQLYYAATLAASLGLAFLLGRGSLPPSAVNQNSGTVAKSEPSSAVEQPFPEMKRPSGLLVHRAGSQASPREVPFMEAQEIDPQEMFAWQDVSRELVETIRRGGDRVTYEQKFVPIQLPDGRRALVPVDRVQIVPKQTY